jgi:hypothetical protein
MEEGLETMTVMKDRVGSFRLGSFRLETFRIQSFTVESFIVESFKLESFRVESLRLESFGLESTRLESRVRRFQVYVDIPVYVYQYIYGRSTPWYTYTKKQCSRRNEEN